MEFLVFIFIIISILSSLEKQMRKNRKVRKKEIDFDPWSFVNKFPREKIKADAEDKKIDYILYPSPKEPAKKRKSSPPIVKEEEKVLISATDHTTQDFTKELADLVTGKRLPLVMLASEILGPPRAIKPIARRKFQ